MNKADAMFKELSKRILDEGCMDRIQDQDEAVPSGGES